MELTREKKIALLEQILASSSFRNKAIYQRLLRYLVETSLNEKVPKEITVALEVFNKETDFNPAEDSTVRVHMHNLRSKLEHYYQNEGCFDSIRLYIPKGHYKVEFHRNSNSTPANNSADKRVLILALLSTILLLFIIVDKFILPHRVTMQAHYRHTKLWTHFFQNNYPTSLVVGDFLVFHEWNDELQRSRRIMDYEINIQEELEAYIQSHPQLYPEPWDLGELPHNILFNMIDIQPVFQSFEQPLNINFTSKIDIDAIKNKNIIYIGEFKNLRVLSNLTAGLAISYETLPWWHGKISFSRNDSTIVLQTSRDWEKSRYVTDLGMLANLPGIDNENYLLCAGFGYNSQIKIVEMISHPESLRQLEQSIIQSYGSFPDYFVMVFEVNGFDRASTTADLKYFSKLDKNEYLQGLVP